jgi:hypothetical protein
MLAHSPIRSRNGVYSLPRSLWIAQLGAGPPLPSAMA